MGIRAKLGTGIRLVLSLMGLGCRPEPEPDPTVPAVTATTLGMVYLQEGRLPEAEAEFRRVIALIPRASSGYANLAQVHLRAERYQEAETTIRLALERDSSSTAVHLLLARVYQRTGRAAEARRLLQARLGAGVADPRVLYAIASLAESSADSAVYLRRTVDAAGANLAVRVALALHLARHGDADGSLAELEEIRKQWPEPPAETVAAFDAALRLLQDGAAGPALEPLERFYRGLELTPTYQAGLREVAGIGGPVAGYPVLTFSPVVPLLGQESALAAALRFTDATGESGLPAGPATGPLRALAAGDYDGDGSDDVVVGNRLWRNESGRFSDATAQAGLATDRPVSVALMADVDNDGHLDLFATGPAGSRLYRNSAVGRFADATPGADLEAAAGVRAAAFVDTDHDGDLDLLLLTSSGSRLYRNNIDGTFTESAGAMGLAGAPGGRSAAFADFDGDGLIDLVVAGEGPVALYRNRGQQRFEEVAVTSGLGPAAGSNALAVGDYDNDGFPDILVAGTGDGGPTLYRNTGAGHFTIDRTAVRGLAGLRAVDVTAVAFLDYDNDGRLDLAAAGTAKRGARPLLLLHNQGSGRFSDRSDLLPATDGPVTSLVVDDYDHDGDEDLLLAAAGGAIRLLQNDGGNARPYLMVQLTALRTASGKNNSFGIGARLELRAGSLYQSRVVTGRQTHFGLGGQGSADALRIEWPNGVPQVLSSGVTAEVREAEVLKGSCAFVYAWDGTRFQLVTDVMWKSALGMPMGIMGSNATYGPPGASTEYVRIPGAALAAKDGRYTLQVTEELWETAYLDQVKLLVVDHPDSVGAFVNERFVPPGPTPLRVYRPTRPRPPRSATDGAGRNLLPLLAARDDRYVAGLTPTRYQGVTELHDLILDLGDLPGPDSVFLFLNGWIYPSDASINVAMAQSSAVKVSPPLLEVRNARGEWQAAIPDLGFPAGKRKTVIANLTGMFPTADHRVRIRTNMQIHWDQAFVAGSADVSPVTITALGPIASDLHYRGFSRTFRKGGRYGPQWFDYSEVSATDPWRLISGRFTRYGDVLELLYQPDDRYVVMAPGDEATLHFDATVPPPLPAGWRRDFLLYTDGWIKDSDLNTATGTAVEPLPFHAMSRYPYGANESYPAGAGYQKYLAGYQTREVRRGRP